MFLNIEYSLEYLQERNHFNAIIGKNFETPMNISVELLINLPKADGALEIL